MAAESAANKEVKADMHAALNALGDALLEIKNFAAALENYRKALAIAEDLAAASPSDLYSLWHLAESYARFGKLYSTLASNPGDATAKRIESLRDSRTWHQKSLDIWNDWSGHAVSSVFDSTRRDEAARAVAQCNDALAKLESSPTR